MPFCCLKLICYGHCVPYNPSVTAVEHAVTPPLAQGRLYMPQLIKMQTGSPKMRNEFLGYEWGPRK